MIGVNELRLNQPTMIEAVQYWLNSKMPKAPTVTSVTFMAEDYSSPVFKIALDSQEGTDAKK